MAATGTPTPNLGLRIPVGTDPASVDDINYNSNLLDTVLGAVGNISVKDQLDELSDQIATKVPTESVSGFRIRKCANIVTVNIDKSVTKSGTGWGNIGVLPTGYKPDIMMYFVGIDNNSADDKQLFLRANTNGDIDVDFLSAGTVQVRATLTFVIS